MTLQALKDKLQELCYKGYAQYEVVTEKNETVVRIGGDVKGDKITILVEAEK